MSKMFEEEAKTLNSIEMSSVRGGIQERNPCACGCGGSQAESDSVWSGQSDKENSPKIDMP